MELLKDFQIKDIIISEDYKNTKPATRKMERAEQRYLKTGKFQATIIINDDNVLIDGYTTYLLAVRYGIEQINVYRGWVEIVEAVHRPGKAKNYTWKVPRRLIGTVTVNDYIIVPSAQGVKRVKVVNVIRQQYPDQIVGRKTLYKKC